MIPSSKFGFHWRSRHTSLGFIDANENFYDLRGTVGNSLGNFRWLDASDNRSRQAETIEDGAGERHFIQDVPGWNALIEKTPWSEDDVSTFQRLIDLRTLDVYEKLLVCGGLEAFTPNSDSEPITPSA